ENPGGRPARPRRRARRSMLLESVQSAVAVDAPAGVITPRLAWVRHPAALIVLGSLVLAALTLLMPSAPTYDPWAWIVWGREIAHLNLSTVDGPSWKPLPVIFTTVFSLAGGAAPALWVLVARAGAIAAVVMTFRVTRRLGGGVAGGIVAAVSLAVAPWWLL